jgi:hypothetical protein
MTTVNSGLSVTGRSWAWATVAKSFRRAKLTFLLLRLRWLAYLWPWRLPRDMETLLAQSFVSHQGLALSRSSQIGGAAMEKEATGRRA